MLKSPWRPIPIGFLQTHVVKVSSLNCPFGCPFVDQFASLQTLILRSLGPLSSQVGHRECLRHSRRVTLPLPLRSPLIGVHHPSVGPVTPRRDRYVATLVVTLGAQKGLSSQFAPGDLAQFKRGFHKTSFNDKSAFFFRGGVSPKNTLLAKRSDLQEFSF